MIRKIVTKENISFRDYEGHFEGSEIVPSRELVDFLCVNSLRLFSEYPINSDRCECGESLKVYQATEKIPFGEFEELEGIVAIELYVCPSCKKWKLDFIG